MPARAGQEPVGFSNELLRGGWLGAFAAFVAPSALLLFAFATLSNNLTGPWGESVVHGLKLVAVAVVAQGVQGMARTFCPDRSRARRWRSERIGPKIPEAPRLDTLSVARWSRLLD